MVSIKDIFMGRVGSSGLVSDLFSLPATVGSYKPLASPALDEL